MKLLRVITLAVALAPALAFAQWQWIDKNGHKVFSDRSPPSDIPAKNIIKHPGSKPVVAAAVEPADSAASAATVAKASPVLPKPSGKDKALEEKKKQAEQEADAKKKAEEERIAQARAENCERAKRSLQAFTSGQRIRVPNAKGELEYLTDEQRAVEAKRLQEVTTADCKS